MAKKIVKKNNKAEIQRERSRIWMKRRWDNMTPEERKESNERTYYNLRKRLKRPGVREAMNRKSREYWAKSPEVRSRTKEKRFANHLRVKYGIDLATYDQMFTAQDGVCAICRQLRISKGSERLHVDHCHDTKRVRGLLCHNCNIAIGMLDDSPERAETVKQYLIKWSKN